MRSGNYHKICTLCVALLRGRMCGGGGGVELLVKISSSSPDSLVELLLCLFSSFGTKKKQGYPAAWGWGSVFYLGGYRDGGCSGSAQSLDLDGARRRCRR